MTLSRLSCPRNNNIYTNTHTHTQYTVSISTTLLLRFPNDSKQHESLVYFINGFTLSQELFTTPSLSLSHTHETQGTLSLTHRPTQKCTHLSAQLRRTIHRVKEWVSCLVLVVVVVRVQWLMIRQHYPLSLVVDNNYYNMVVVVHC